MPNATQQFDRATDHFELVLRVQPARNSDPQDSESGGARVQALVRDILKSRLNVEAESSGGIYVRARGFSDLAKALAASRALQLACEGFRSAAPGERASLSVVLDSPAPEESFTGPASLSVEQRDLLNLAKPSQVLITQALYDRIAQYQPLALRSFPARAGVYEFLWTSVQRLEQLRAEGEWMPTLVAQPEPVEDLQNTVISYPSLRIPEEPAREPVRSPAPQRREIREEIPEEDEPAHGPSVARIVAIGAAAAILIAIAFLGVWRYMMVRPSGNPPVVAAPPSPTVANPTNGPVAPAVSTPPSTPAEISQPPSTLSKVKDKVDKALKPKAPAAADQSEATTPANPSPRSARCSIEPANIPIALQMAQNSRNHGQLDDAERQFREVLDCAPNNRQARSGLQRTIQDQQLH